MIRLRRARRRKPSAFGKPIPTLYGTPIPPQLPGPATIGTTPEHAWLTVMRVKAIYNEYLECEGWDPWTHGYMKTVNVARPYLLRDAASDYGGEFVTQIRYPTYNEDVTKVAYQDRTAVYSDWDSTAHPQEVMPPYFEGELLVAARLHSLTGQPAVSPRTDGSHVQQTPDEATAPTDYPMKVLKDASGNYIYWMDLNVGGRRWESRIERPVIWNGYLASDENIAKNANADLSWTELDSDGSGITHSTTDITLVNAGWYEVNLTLSFGPNEAPNDQCAFFTYFKLDGTTIWALEMENIKSTQGYGADAAGFSHKFKATAGQVFKVNITGAAILDFTMIGDASAANTRCALAVQWLR